MRIINHLGEREETSQFLGQKFNVYSLIYSQWLFGARGFK